MALGGLTYLIMKVGDKWKERKKNHSISITAEKNIRIQEILTEIRLKYQAERSYLSMFHNGQKYSSGSEILKFSRTNECVKEGVSLESQFYQDIHVSLVPEEMKLVIDNSTPYLKTKELPDGKFRRMLVARDIKAVARAGICKSDEIIGFIGLDFGTDQGPPVDIELLSSYYAILMEQIL